MFPLVASSSGVFPEHGSGLYPLVILLLMVGWGVFVVCAGERLVRLFREGLRSRDGAAVGGGRMSSAALLLVLIVAVVAALWASPLPPVLSTYTGLMHVSSAEQVASLDWHGGFPADYPLATPVFASFVISAMGEGIEAYGTASLLLVLIGVAGTFLLAAALLRALSPAVVAALVAGVLPLVLLVARGDSLGVGKLALAPWCVLFFLDRLSAAEGSRRSAFAFAGCAASLALLCQARPEALAAPGVLVFAALLIPGENGARHALRKLVPVLAAGMAAVLPHIVQFVGVFLASGRLWTDVRYHVATSVMALAVVGVLAAVQLVMGSRQELAQWLDRRLLLAAGGLLAAYCTAGLALWGPGFLIPEGVCFGGDCTASTFKTVASWHINPTLVPLPLVGLFFVGMMAAPARGEARLGAFLILWAGWVLAGASLKPTGELPFDGARTQVAATVPFALLAAMGARRVVRAIIPGWRRWVTLVAVVLPFYPVTLMPLFGFDYVQQQEFEILSRCAADIPDGSLLYAPDDTIREVRVSGDRNVPVDLYALHRTDHLVDMLGPKGGSLVARRAAHLWTGEDRPEDERRSYFVHSLNCYRGAAGGVNPSCRQVHETLELEPICRAQVVNRAYTADFYDQLRIHHDEVTVGIYRVVGEIGE